MRVYLAALVLGMAAVVATPYYTERCARVPDNRERLLRIPVLQKLSQLAGACSQTVA